MAKKKTNLIIYSHLAYGESSLILHAIGREAGSISIMAKGYRTSKTAAPLIIPGEYEVLLFEPQEQGLWLLSEISLSKNRAEYPNPATWTAALCGIELIAQVISPPHDQPLLYDLLIRYLDYLKQVPSNAILIFWRFMIRICSISGIGHPLSTCCSCQSPINQYDCFNLRESGFICSKCREGNPNHNELLEISQPAGKLLALMPKIGNYLDSFRLSRSVVVEIDHLLQSYWAGHTKQTLRLKSLSVLIQFYS